MQKDIFNDAIKRLDEAAKFANIESEVLDSLKQPTQALEVSVPVRMDNGTLEIFKGFRVRHNDIKGPTKGGIRFHPSVTIEEVKALSCWMTLKCALAGLPYGGGKGGISVDSKKLSNLELEKLSRSYINKIADFIGPDVDIPAPDVYTNSTIMSWMMDEYSKINRKSSPAVITGKPISLGGSLGRDDATGRGAYYCIKELEKIKKWNPRDITVAVQGFGNAGQHVASLLYKDGYKIVAISDSKTAVFSEKEGIDIDRAIDIKNKTGMVMVDKSVNITNSEILELDVDVLIPAALENQITLQNAKQIKAKVIVEVANGPVKKEADPILLSNDNFIIPDILANAGGVVVSYFEWVQNKSGFYWTEEEVHNKLQKIMSNAFEKVYVKSSDSNIDMRTAANAVALEEINKAYVAKGTYSLFKKEDLKLDIREQSKKMEKDFV